MDRFFLSVVIPSYNEMANLQKGTLEKLKNYFERNKDRYKYEVIIVDDGSDDGSCEFVDEFVKRNKTFKILKNEHSGKAGAVTSGVLEAQGDYILFTDMDQATPIEELEKLMLFFNDGYDIVIGSRNDKRKGAPVSRKVMAKGMMLLRAALVGIPEIKDTQCGFKIFSRKSARDIFSTIKKIHSGFNKIKGSSVTAGFDVELLYIASKKGFKIKEVPVSWLYVETRRVSPFSDSIEGLKELVRIRYNILKGVYKLNA